MIYTAKIKDADIYDAPFENWQDAERMRERMQQDTAVLCTIKLLQSEIIVVDSEGKIVHPLSEKNVQKVILWLNTSSYFNNPGMAIPVDGDVPPIRYAHKKSFNSITGNWTDRKKNWISFNRIVFHHRDGRAFHAAEDQFARVVVSEKPFQKKYVIAGNHNEYRDFCNQNRLRDGLDACYLKDFNTVLGLKDMRKSDVIYYGDWTNRKDSSEIQSYIEKHWRK